MREFFFMLKSMREKRREKKDSPYFQNKAKGESHAKRSMGYARKKRERKEIHPRGMRKKIHAKEHEKK